MAQERVLGHPVGHRGAEGGQVVDPLSGEASFPEQILVDVGDSERVWVDPRRPGEDPLEARALVLGR